MHDNTPDRMALAALIALAMLSGASALDAGSSCQPFVAQVFSVAPSTTCLSVYAAAECGGALMLTSVCPEPIRVIGEAGTPWPEPVLNASNGTPVTGLYRGPVAAIQQVLSEEDVVKYQAMPKEKCAYGNYLGILSSEGVDESAPKRLLGVVCQGGLQDGTEVKKWTIRFAAGDSTIAVNGRTIVGSPNQAVLPSLNIAGPLLTVLLFGGGLIAILLLLVKLSSTGDQPPEQPKKEENVPATKPRQPEEDAPAVTPGPEMPDVEMPNITMDDILGKQ